MKKHRMQVGEWVKVGLWCALAAIPAGILGICLALIPAQALTTGPTRVLVPSMGGVALIVIAALWVIANRIAQIQHESRRGRACIACSYDMRADPRGTCPECGMEEAAMQPFRGPRPAMVMWLIGWVLLVIVGVAASWRFGVFA